MNEGQDMSLRTCFLLAFLVTAIGLACVMFIPVTPPDAAFTARMEAIYGPNKRRNPFEFVPAFPR